MRKIKEVLRNGSGGQDQVVGRAGHRRATAIILSEAKEFLRRLKRIRNVIHYHTAIHQWVTWAKHSHRHPAREGRADELMGCF